MNFLRDLFSHVCGQQHCWVLGGQALPFCQRCTGLYVGAFCALLLILLFRPRPNAFLYWIHGIFMLAMIPFGFHFVAHGGLTRTLTGGLFGFGLVYYLVLNPFTAWQAWKADTAWQTRTYLLLIVILLSLLLLTVRLGSGFSGLVLTGLGVLGFAALCLLTAVNLAVLPGAFRTLRSRSPLQSE
jgi:uncharacterized membrane protein